MKNTQAVWLCALAPLACGNLDMSSGESGAIGLETPVDDRPVTRAAKVPPPISGGTLLVSDDGAYAVASDPDHDTVHIVDLETFVETTTLELPDGAQPFRAAQDEAGLVHITLRGTGQILTVDPESGDEVSRTAVCPNPRGLAFVADTNAIAVACAGGQVVQLDADSGTVVRADRIGPDLRDVFIDRGELMVTRFRSAEVRSLGEDGASELRGAPQSLSLDSRIRAPSTAWKTSPMPYGGWLMLHQLANTRPLPIDPEDTEGAEGGEGGGYAGGPFSPPCDGAVQPSLTAMRPDGTLVHAPALESVALAVDAAIAPNGQSIVVASPSQSRTLAGPGGLGPASLFTLDVRDFDGEGEAECTEPNGMDVEDDFVAVAFEPDGTLLALARATPKLYRFDGNELREVIDLAAEQSAIDTGHDLFHKDAGSGLSCASCHPEGGDDGRVWSFLGHGPRRTQPLDAGLAGTEPFHWEGDMGDMSTLVHEVRGRRMGGAEQTDERVDSIQQWLFALPLPNPVRGAGDELATEGARLFASFGCDTCHSGPSLTSNGFSDFGKGSLQIPTLRGVALRAPFMHDGRSADLVAATRDMLTVSPGAPEASDAEVDAVVAYLETL